MIPSLTESAPADSSLARRLRELDLDIGTRTAEIARLDGDIRLFNGHHKGVINGAPCWMISADNFPEAAKQKARLEIELQELQNAWAAATSALANLLDERAELQTIERANKSEVSNV